MEYIGLLHSAFIVELGLSWQWQAQVDALTGQYYANWSEECPWELCIGLDKNE